MEINKAWIDGMRAVCDVATPGPWEVTGFYKTQVAPTVGKGSTVCAAATNNANFIAAARTALPAALDALEASMKESERLKDSLGRHVQAEIGVSMSLSEFFPDHGEDHERIIIAAAKASAEIARLTAERDAAVKDFKASIETDHCQYCKNMEKCEQKAEREQTYAYPFKGCGFNWVGLRTKDAPTGAESGGEHAE